MQREPLTELVGTPSRLVDLQEEEARHRRLLRLGLAVALWFHLALLLAPIPTHSVAVAEKEATPVVHLVPLPQYSPPPPPNSREVRRPRRQVPVPEVLLAEPLSQAEEIDLPITYQPGVFDEIVLPPPPEPEPEGPVYVGGVIAQPERLVYVEPVYPPAALKARLAGLVILQVLLGKDGAVRDVTVLRAGSMGMTESAEAAVRQWRYEPALLNGRPVEALMTVTVTFTLR